MEQIAVTLGVVCVFRSLRFLLLSVTHFTNTPIRQDEKGDAIYFQFSLTMCQRARDVKEQRRKEESKRDEIRRRLSTKLGIRFPFILVCMLLDDFVTYCGLNDNYPRVHVKREVLNRGHLAFGT